MIVLEREAQREVVMGSKGGEPEEPGDSEHSGVLSAVDAPQGDHQRQGAGGRDEDRTVGPPETCGRHYPPHRGAAQSLARVVGLGGPYNECGQYQSEEKVRGVVLQLERVMKAPLAQRAKKQQDARGGRRQPATSDPEGGSEDGYAE